MRLTARASGTVRALVLALTIVAVSLVLVVGQGDAPDPVVLQEGDTSPEEFIATRLVEVVDDTATEVARQSAARSVEEVYTQDSATTEAVLSSISAFFANVEMVAQPLEIPVVDTDPTITTTSTTTTTTTTEPPTTTTEEGADTTTGDDTTSSTTSTTTTTTTTLPPTTTTSTTLPITPPEPVQIAELRDLHPLLALDTIEVMVEINGEDVDRLDVGEAPVLRLAETEALDLADQMLETGIRSGELEQLKADLVGDPPTLILLRDLDAGQRTRAEAAVADLVANSLQANLLRDEIATQLAREEAMESVSDVTVAFQADEAIVRANEVVDAVELKAIEELGLLDPADSAPPMQGVALIAALIVMLAAIYLWRVGREYWREPKMVALFGLLLVLAALAARIPDLIARDQVALGFMIPAALLGYLTASLFDARLAAVMAVPMAAFTALGTESVALVVFAVGATLTPIPLVSAVSSRAQLNVSVALSAILLAPLAAALAWFFYGTSDHTVELSAVFGATGGVVSGIAALGLMPFLASLFGITTTQTLLDMTDRNHPGLRALEEKASGTFNHCIMVGNLAGKAARAIGGNVLLAQAMAYYHDLGKTAAPQYYVENQFGVSNPHDDLDPAHSAGIIRSHVAEGLRLARDYRIPPDVAQGIMTHHGTSLMRFFYHKAIDLYGEDAVNPADFRHRGRKPRSKEMVIVMMSDASEAAARALAQNEDPTSDSLRDLVESIIAEKVEDGQLEESEVTFGELTRIKETLVDGLIGYYHARIPYPGFPGAQPVS